MIDNNQLGHFDFHARAQHLRNVLPASRVNENLAFNFQSLQAVLNAWINSAKQNENLLGDFTNFGISITFDNSNRPYYTMIFIKK